MSTAEGSWWRAGTALGGAFAFGLLTTAGGFVLYKDVALGLDSTVLEAVGSLAIGAGLPLTAWCFYLYHQERMKMPLSASEFPGLDKAAEERRKRGF